MGENKLAFQNHHKQFSTPFTNYADFEAISTKIEGPKLNPMKSNTRKRQHHEACSYCYIVVRCDGQTELPVKYRGSNAAEHVLEALQEEERKIKTVLAYSESMQMTREDWRAHNSAATCHVCEEPLEDDSVRDHYHITGTYRGAANNACNLKLRLKPKTTDIPVVFHNWRGYDSHLLMQAFSKVEGRISNNMEKYISFFLGQLRFIDSAQFLLASLDKLVAASSVKRFGTRRGTSRPKRGANCLCARASTPTNTWTPESALPSPNSPKRKPSTASFQTSTSAMSSTDMHSASGWFSKPWGSTTITTTAATSNCWQMI